MIKQTEWQRRESISRLNRALKAVETTYSMLIRKLLQEDRFQTPEPNELHFLRNCEETLIYLREIKRQVKEGSIELPPYSFQLIVESKI